MKRLFKVIGLGITLGCLLLAGLVFALQNKLIYFPQRYIGGAEPGSGPMQSFRDFTTADGRTQWGYLIQPPGEPESQRAPPESSQAGDAGTDTSPRRPRFHLVFNGNASTALAMSDFFEELARRTGCGFFIVDYRGYGFNDGRPTESGLLADALGAFDSLEKEGFFEEGVGVIGHSLGGAVALALAVQRDVDQVITLSTFTSIDAMARRTVIWPLYYLSVNHWPNDRRLKELLARPAGERPHRIILFHGRNDEIIPFAMGQALASIPGERSTFIALDRAGHNNVHDFALDDLARLLRVDPTPARQQLEQ